MRKLLATVLACVMVLSLAACGEKEVKPNVIPPVVTPPVVTGPEVKEPEVTEPIQGDRVEVEPPLVVDDIGPEEPPVEDEEPTEGDGTIGDIFGSGSGSDGDSEGDSEGEEEPTEPNEEELKKLNPDAGEKSISSGLFDGGVATEQNIRELLHVNAAQVSYEVITNAVTLLNSYSKEGVIRFVEDNSGINTVSNDMKNAVILAYRVLGLPMKKLYEDGFVDENLVTIVEEVLDNAEKEWKEAESGKKK